ncbi:hypothetical protein LEMLEM_LOCUS3118 [Lemmus lemmus]
MSVEKEVPFRVPHPGPKVRSKQFRGPRGRSKARARGARSKAHVHRRSQPEPYCKKAQVREKEKVWTPWNDLIVIGKRVELLDRNLQKSKVWDPKLESENWKLEVMGKKISKERSGLHQEKVGTKLLNGVERTSQAPARLEDDIPEEIWGQQDRPKAGAVSKSAEMTAEPDERLKSKDKLRTSGGDLRSRGDQLRQNEEVESSGENLVYKREKRVSIGEKVVGRGEKRSVVEKMDSKEKRGSIREKVSDSGEKRGSIRKVSDSGEKRGSIREKVSDSGEKRGSIRKKSSDSGEKRGSIREKVSDSGEKRGSIREKASDSGEIRRSSKEKAKSSDEKLKLSREKSSSSEGEKPRTGDKNLRSTEDKLESNIEEVQSDEMNLEEHSSLGSTREESVERVVTITGDESAVEKMSQEMQIPGSLESTDEQEGAEKAGEIDSFVLDYVEDTDESVPIEEKDKIREGSGESGG